MRTAVVFGASGGIGGALLRRLAASGDYGRIFAGARSGLREVPTSVVPFQFDLDDEGSIAGACAALDASPDLVIVATGVLHDAERGIAPEKSLRAFDPATMARVMMINTIGPAAIARHCLPLLPRDRRSVFAVLSARVGSITDNRLGGWHAYRASKAALNMLIKTFAIEMAYSRPHAILAALHPGTVDTGLSAPFQRGVTPERLFSPEQSAGHLLDMIASLTPSDSGGLFAWNSERIPY